MSQAAAAVVAKAEPKTLAAPGPIDHSKKMASFDYMTMMGEVAQGGGRRTGRRRRKCTS